MAIPYGKGEESIAQAEHIGLDKTGDNIEAKRSANYVWDANSSTWVRMTQPGGGSGGNTTDVTPTGVFDSGNSTTTPLGSNATFTGTWQAWDTTSTTGYVGIQIDVYTNVLGGTGNNGVRALVVQFSSDGGTTIDRQLGVDILAASTNGGMIMTFGRQGTHYRLTYTNGSTAQTTFRLATVSLTRNPPARQMPINDSLTDRTEATVTRSVVMGKDAVTGTYGNVNTFTVNGVVVQANTLLDIFGGFGVFNAEHAALTADVEHTLLIDTASGTVTYLGYAVPGTATSAASWKIKKIDSSSGTTIKYADGVGTYTKIWDNRASYSYS